MTLIAEERVGLMQQNAHQILNVVKETFTHLSFDGRAVVSGCSQDESEGEILSCMWSQVVHTLQYQDQADAVGVLTAVSLSRTVTEL